MIFMPTVLVITGFIMIVEIIAIRNITNDSKEPDIRHPLLASLFPMVYLFFKKKHPGADRAGGEESTVEDLHSALASADKKIKLTDCISTINLIKIESDYTIDNTDSKYIMNKIMDCYSEPLTLLPKSLTDKEKQICILFYMGIKPQFIGDLMFISYSTVRTHKARAINKLSEEEICLIFNT